jgi:X-X-X-Leu-X-X-Gly heptad repeat protein
MNAGRILATMAILVVARAASAQTANQIVTFQVDAINQIAFVGSPSLVINTATAGSNPTSATAAATWAVTTNQTGAKITASIGSNMPAGLTLSVNLSAPAGGSSAGAQSLSTGAVDLVTGITKLAQGALGVSYSLDATLAAGVVASTTRTVTYTITGGT